MREDKGGGERGKKNGYYEKKERKEKEKEKETERGDRRRIPLQIMDMTSEERCEREITERHKKEGASTFAVPSHHCS